MWHNEGRPKSFWPYIQRSRYKKNSGQFILLRSLFELQCTYSIIAAVSVFQSGRRVHLAPEEWHIMYFWILDDVVYSWWLDGGVAQQASAWMILNNCPHSFFHQLLSEGHCPLYTSCRISLPECLYQSIYSSVLLPSMLCRCWLGGRKSIQPIKTWVLRCWHGYLSEVRCKWLAHDLVGTTATPASLLQWNPEWFILLVPAYSGLSWTDAVKWV